MRWKNHLPRLILHEKFEKHVKWTSRGIAAVAIVSSVFSIPVWHLSLSIAITIFLLQQFLERCIFEYTSIYIQPMPDFPLNTNEWKAMTFAFPQNQDTDLLNVVGCAFATREYAHKFFGLLREWNYEQNEDRDNNICISFILEDSKHYIAFLYPNPNRPTVNEFFQSVEENEQHQKGGKEHQKLIMQMVLGKRFPYGSSAALNTFVESQKNDRPFWIKPFLMNDDGSFMMIEGEKSILKHSFKIRSKNDLHPKEYEYHFLKNH